MGGGGGGDNSMMMIMSIMMMQQMQQMQQQQMQQINAQQESEAQKQARQVQADVQANTWDMLRQYGQNSAQTAAGTGNMTNPMASRSAASPGTVPTTNLSATPLLTQLASNPMTSTATAATSPSAS
jgi:hypothetical protein